VQDPFDPDLLTPEQRAREVAELLARGYLRLRKLLAFPGAPAPQERGRQREKELDAPGDQSVHVPRHGGA
jgi:hypothetical protein